MAAVAQAVAIARMEPCFPGDREDRYSRGGPSEAALMASSRRAGRARAGYVGRTMCLADRWAAWGQRTDRWAAEPRLMHLPCSAQDYAARCLDTPNLVRDRGIRPVGSAWCWSSRCEVAGELGPGGYTEFAVGA
jgi:hypothetical protein